jgi:hypothetical protein
MPTAGKSRKSGSLPSGMTSYLHRDHLASVKKGTVLVRYNDSLEEIDERPYSGGDVPLTDKQSIAGSLAVEIMLRQKLNIRE